MEVNLVLENNLFYSSYPMGPMGWDGMTCQSRGMGWDDIFFMRSHGMGWDEPASPAGRFFRPIPSHSEPW
jgi:hypothetical protein